VSSRLLVLKPSSNFEACFLGLSWPGPGLPYKELLQCNSSAANRCTIASHLGRPCVTLSCNRLFFIYFFCLFICLQLARALPGCLCIFYGLRALVNASPVFCGAGWLAGDSAACTSASAFHGTRKKNPKKDMCARFIGPARPCGRRHGSDMGLSGHPCDSVCLSLAGRRPSRWPRCCRRCCGSSTSPTASTCTAPASFSCRWRSQTSGTMATSSPSTGEPAGCDAKGCRQQDPVGPIWHAE
jgi:hypothetical protein